MAKELTPEARAALDGAKAQQAVPSGSPETTTMAEVCREEISFLAHLITGHIGSSCCHKTGGYNRDPRCECRGIAESLLLEDAEKVQAALDGVAKKRALP